MEFAGSEGVRVDVDRVALAMVAFEVAGRELRRAGRRITPKVVPVRICPADGRAAAAVTCEDHGTVDARRRAGADVAWIVENILACALDALGDDVRRGEPRIGDATEAAVVDALRFRGDHGATGTKIAAVVARRRSHCCGGAAGMVANLRASRIASSARITPVSHQRGISAA